MTALFSCLPWPTDDNYLITTKAVSDRNLQHQYENAVRESGLDKFYKAKQAREAQVSRESRNRTLLTCGAFLAAVAAIVAAGKGCASVAHRKDNRETIPTFDSYDEADLVHWMEVNMDGSGMKRGLFFLQESKENEWGGQEEEPRMLLKDWKEIQEGPNVTEDKIGKKVEFFDQMGTHRIVRVKKINELHALGENHPANRYEMDYRNYRPLRNPIRRHPQSR